MKAPDTTLSAELVNNFFRPLKEFGDKKEKGTKAKAILTYAITGGRLLSFINTTGLTDAKRENLLRCFFKVCLAFREEAQVIYQTVDRLHDELEEFRMQHART